MKTCSKCGMANDDGMLFCSGCGTNLEDTTHIESKPDVESTLLPRSKKKTIKAIIIAAAAFILVAGGVFSFFLIKNYQFTEEISSQLMGNTYQYEDEIIIELQNYESYSVQRLTFLEHRKCRCESYFSAFNDDVIDYTIDYEVKKTSNGEIILQIGKTSPTVYTIEYDESGQIKALIENNFSHRFYKIQREDGYQLADYVAEYNARREAEKEAEKRAKELEANKQQALKMFTEFTMWQGTIYKFDNLIPTVFADYTLTCEPKGDSITDFIITVTGPYYFNKVDLPTLTREGKLSCQVTIGLEENILKIIADNGVTDAMDLYVIRRTYRW